MIDVADLDAIGDAYNADDIDGVSALFAPEADAWGLGAAGDGATRERVNLLVTTLGDAVDLEPCVLVGDGRDVDCEVTFTDALHGAAGITLVGIEHHRFGDDGRIPSVSMTATEPDNYQTMEGRLATWLEDAHPEEAAAVALLSYWSEERFLILLNRVDEFVADSDDYPPTDTPEEPDMCG